MSIKILKLLDKVTPGASRSLSWETLLTALSLPASILLNRTLGAEDRGVLALVVLIPSTMFGLGGCQWYRLVKGLITSQQISSREAWRRTLFYAFLLSFISVPLGMMGSLFYPNIPDHVRLLSVLYCLTFPVFFLTACLGSIYLAAGSVDGQYWIRIAQQSSYLILLFGLYYWEQLSIMSVVLSYMSMHTIALAFGWIHKKKLLMGTYEKTRPPISILVKGFFPYALSTFGGRIDIWSFSLFGAVTTLGQYSAILGLMMPIGLISNALGSGSVANLDWTRQEVVHAYLVKTVGILLSVLVIILIAGNLGGAYVLELILGKSFESGAWLITWIALIVVIQAAVEQFHSALQLSGLQNAYLTIQTIEPGVRLVLVLGLGWWLSEKGVLLGMIFSSILMVFTCLWYYMYSNKVLESRYEAESE
ncbi:MAG: hypothetical protein HQM14_18480 [SAR324 cluster bacterium]|nr:hypothetical protein [SAR324 cluster bacterium]